MSGAVMDGPVMSSDKVFRYPVDVRFFEVDPLGVAFYMWYLGWCDEAMSAFMEVDGRSKASIPGGLREALVKDRT